MPFFIRGVPGKSGQSDSVFTQDAIGYNTLAKVPAVIAQWLGLKSPEKYTLSSFKRILRKPGKYQSQSTKFIEENSDQISADPIFIKSEQNNSSAE